MPNNSDGNRSNLNTVSGNTLDPGGKRPAWYTLLNRYHWFVLLVAALGWLFDTMDQQLFALARAPAMNELLATAASPNPTSEEANFAGMICTSIFLIGWAFGGLVFGALGDRIGRARVMIWTIVIYSVFTGLSSFSTTVYDFAFYRFLTGLGVGGEFAVGVALVAEAMPALARPYALGLLQASSTLGNSIAALVSIAFGTIELSGGFEGRELFGFALTPWRVMFMIGALPALLALVIRSRLKEPEAWVNARAEMAKNPNSMASRDFGSYRALFANPIWRKNAFVGLALGCAGIVGLWGIGFFSFELVGGVIKSHFENSPQLAGVDEKTVSGTIARWKGITSLLQNAGGFFGMYMFGYVSNWIGRRLTFAICFVAAMASTALVFAQLDEFSEIFWMIPLMGFCQLSLFGGYAVYFPEIFPTHLRSTGISFCYNVGRILAAIGPLALGAMTKYVFTKENGFDQGLRWAGVTMCLVFVIGLVALPFAPETKGKPLPD